jgi:hypothetical protein
MWSVKILEIPIVLQAHVLPVGIMHVTNGKCHLPCTRLHARHRMVSPAWLSPQGESMLQGRQTITSVHTSKQ